METPECKAKSTVRVKTDGDLPRGVQLTLEFDGSTESVDSGVPSCSLCYAFTCNQIPNHHRSRADTWEQKQTQVTHFQTFLDWPKLVQKFIQQCQGMLTIVANSQEEKRSTRAAFPQAAVFLAAGAANPEICDEAKGNRLIRSKGIKNGPHCILYVCQKSELRMRTHQTSSLRQQPESYDHIQTSTVTGDEN
ncbi:hypothetical protein U0070_006750 [Myodes glareolus]|uniref:Uncharacterized protein n=1 Tax=Myodes glareolus TaxID=447135 RepID=A0AAW0HDG2_MYOGA